MATKKTEPKSIDPLATRKKLGLNQSDFWSRIGVTQSGGCRYEKGRSIPRPVRILLTLTYGGPAADKAFSALKYPA